MGWAPLQWVGDHSYSLYLWHWPPLVALPWVLHGELGNGVRVGILAATVVLAWVTKALVEDPARTPWPRRARWPSLVLAATGMCVLLAGTTAVNATVGELEQRASASAADRVASNKSCFGASALVDAGCRRPFARPSVAKVAFASRDDDPALRGCQLDVGHPTEPLWCEWSTTEHPTTTIAVVGNSFAGQLATTVRQWAADRPIRILLAARTGCLGLSGTPVSRPAGRRPVPHLVGQGLVTAAGHGRPVSRRVQRSPRCGCVHDRADTSRPPRPRASGGRRAPDVALTSSRRRRHGRRGGSPWAPDGDRRPSASPSRPRATTLAGSRGSSWHRGRC